MKTLFSMVAVAAAVLLVAPDVASAQAAGECSSGFCGTPKQVGGGGGCGCGGGSILINFTDMGETYSTSDDFDLDGFEDDFDNCPFIGNRDQRDADGDGIGDGCDNAASVANPDQRDTDGNGIGDVIDPDIDGDELLNDLDNCPNVFNPSQRVTIPDHTVGDACNPDDDLDGVLDLDDPCPKIANAAAGSAACFGDDDLDGIPDEKDNCETIFNPEQGNLNAAMELEKGLPSLGDLCDPDMDGDEVLNNLDNAVQVFNPDQLDLDRDGLGDVADPRFCYHFAPSATEESCLDPLGTFQVRGLAIKVTDPSKPVQLALFANRIDTALEYTWKIVKAPEGSEASIQHATGRASNSLGGYQYIYEESGFGVPQLVADVEGTYEVRVEAKQIFPDAIYGTSRPSQAAVSVKAGEGEASGCAAAGGKASLGAGLLVGLALLLRRRSVR